MQQQQQQQQEQQQWQQDGSAMPPMQVTPERHEMLEQQQQVQRMQGRYDEQMRRLQEHTRTVEWHRTRHVMCDVILLCGFIVWCLLSRRVAYSPQTETRRL